jgi:hypothetical protein
MTVTCPCGRPVPDQAYCCSTCGNRLGGHLAEVTPQLALALDDTFSRQSRGGNLTIGAHAHTFVPPAPWDERASTTGRQLRSTLTTWCRVVDEERGTSPPADTLPAMAAHLAGNLEWIRHHPAAAECVDDVCRGVAAAWHAVDRHPDRLYAGPCWRKDDVTGAACSGELYAGLDAVVAVCPVCNWRFDVAERRAWLLEAARDVLASATLISAALSRLEVPVTVDRLWQWQHRGRVFNHSAPGEDPTYRVGDVIDLLDAWAVQQAERAARKAS